MIKAIKDFLTVIILGPLCLIGYSFYMVGQGILMLSLIFFGVICVAMFALMPFFIVDCILQFFLGVKLFGG